MKFFAKANKDRGEIYVYEQIGEDYWSGGGITAVSFQKALKDLGDVKSLDVYINSPGGNVFDGIAIFNQLERHAAHKTMYVDGIAASIASVILMAGDEIKIAANGMVMIHNPWGFAMGTAQDMRKTADSLDAVRDNILGTYVARTKGKADVIKQQMDDETWLDADKAVAAGFADAKVDEKKVNASFKLLEKFAKVPDVLKSQPLDVQARQAHMRMVASKYRGQSRGVK